MYYHVWRMSSLRSTRRSKMWWLTVQLGQPVIGQQPPTYTFLEALPTIFEFVVVVFHLYNIQFYLTHKPYQVTMFHYFFQPSFFGRNRFLGCNVHISEEGLLFNVQESDGPKSCAENYVRKNVPRS